MTVLEKAFANDKFMTDVNGQIDKANYMYSEALKILRKFDIKHKLNVSE